MDENIMQLDEEMVRVAMEIITEAGDARMEITKSLDSMEKGDFEAADEHLVAARKLLAKAHGMQTDIIQSEGEGELRQHPLLFIHAQDTLMTINSELNLCRKLRGIFSRIDARLDKLEKGE